MLAITISINIFLLPLLAIVSFLIGYSFRSNNIKKMKKQVSSLEKEMLNSHAEILNLQQELNWATKKTNPKSLVVSMKDAAALEEEQDQLSEANRKQAK
jgi:hypothetical protein